MRRAVVLAAAMVLALAGCSSPSGSAGRPARSTPPGDGGSYTDPVQLAEAAHLGCSDLKTATPIGSRAQVTCSDGDVVVRVYEGHDGVADQVNLMRLTGGHLLTGQNWTINAPEGALSAARDIVGGELVTIPCAKPDCALATPAG